MSYLPLRFASRSLAFATGTFSNILAGINFGMVGGLNSRVFADSDCASRIFLHDAHMGSIPIGLLIFMFSIDRHFQKWDVF